MSNRTAYGALLLIALAGILACGCGDALLWDGAYQLCSTLLTGHAFLYLSRFHSGVVWWPLAHLAPMIGSLTVLKFLYGLPFCLAPLAGAAGSWWIVRRSAPHLFLWALFGTALAPLPGQIFMINDSIFQLHLFWPVFLAALLPVSVAQAAAMAVLSLFQLSHPLGIGLCAFTAVAAMALRRPGWAGWFALLAVAGVWKLLHWPDDYAAREATFAQLHNTFVGGVKGWPGDGMVALWMAAAALLWIGGRPASRLTPPLGWTALGLLACLGLGWSFWAADPAQWQGALSFRRWAPPAIFPLYLAAGWEIWRGKPVSGRYRNAAGWAAGAIFFVVLGLQSWTTAGLFQHLSREIAASSSWLPVERLSWVQGTALDHWGLESQVLSLQGRHPRVLLADPASLAAARENPPRLALSPFNLFRPVPGPPCWFDLEGLPVPPGPSPPPPATSSLFSHP